MEKHAHLSIQQILQARTRDEFIGREDALASFDRNLETDPTRRYFIFNIYGQGGVGKTSLLERFRDAMKRRNSLTAYVNEEEIGIVEVMSRIAQQFREEGQKLREFEAKFDDYLKLRHELEADPDMPQGLSAVIARSVVRGGVRIGKDLITHHVPGSGILLDDVNEDVIAEHTDEALAWLRKKLQNRDKDDVRLIHEPAEVLTPLFLDGMRAVMDKQQVGVFIDTYERSGNYLDEWLRTILTGRYGQIPATLVFVIAGRNALDANAWVQFEPILASIRLDPFTLAETRQFLEKKGIINAHTADVIRRLSGGLPLLLATLAASHPSEPSDVGDPFGTAIERFLKWVDDPSLRTVAVDAALTRYFNADVIACLPSANAIERTFDWLRSMPFIESRRGGWKYHDTVRSLLIHHKQRQSPADFKAIHGRLAAYYASLVDTAHLSPFAFTKGSGLRSAVVEIIYHTLCRDQFKALSFVLNGFVSAFTFRTTYGRSWAQAIWQAGDDTDLEILRDWGNTLLNGVKAFEQRQYEEAARMFSALLQRGQLSAELRPQTLVWHARLMHLARHDEQALNDLSNAIKMDSSRVEWLTERALILQDMGRFDSAIEDFTTAIAMSSEAPSKQRWLVRRGLAKLNLGEADEALADIEHALEIGDDGIALAAKAFALHRLHRDDEALACSDQSLASEADPHVLYEQRGALLSALGRYEEAIAAYGTALELSPNCAYTLAGRGRAFTRSGQLAGALDDLNAALGLAMYDAWLIQRGEVHVRLGQLDAAIADYIALRNVNPSHAHRSHKRIGQILVLQENYGEAAREFHQALTSHAECTPSWAGLAQCARKLEDSEEGVYRRLSGERVSLHLRTTQQPLARIAYAHALFEAGLIDQASVTLKSIGRTSIHDVQWLQHRAWLFEQLGDYGEAADDLIAACDLGSDKSDLTLIGIGLMLGACGRYREAITNYSSALDLHPKSYVARYFVSVTTAKWHGISESSQELAIIRAELEQALVNEDNPGLAQYCLAGLEALVGQEEAALLYLRGAVAAGPEHMKSWAKRDVAFAELRATPPFDSIVDGADTPDRNLESDVWANDYE